MERPTKRLDAAVLGKWRALGVFWIIASAIGLGVASFVIRSTTEIAPALTGTVAILAWLAVCVAAVGLPPLMYRRWRYEIRERDVFISRGALFHSLVLVPFDRIQFVETEQGPIDRIFDIAGVKIYTAGGSSMIPGLNEQEADSLREELSKVAGTTTV